jgi:hypothetical protein
VTGWGSLIAIIAEARTAAVRPPGSRCPNDGTPLQQARGVLHCPFDGWTGSASEAEPAGPSIPDPSWAVYTSNY